MVLTMSEQAYTLPMSEFNNNDDCTKNANKSIITRTIDSIRLIPWNQTMLMMMPDDKIQNENEPKDESFEFIS